MRAGLNDQLRRLAQQFERDARDACTTLLPTAAEICELAHRMRYAQWDSFRTAMTGRLMGSGRPPNDEFRAIVGVCIHAALKPLAGVVFGDY